MIGLFLAALVTPAPTPSPQSADIAVPPSWHVQNWRVAGMSKPAAFTRLGTWTSDTGAEVITLDVAPSLGANLQRIVSFAGGVMQRTQPTFVLRESRSLKLCSGQPGWEQDYSGPQSGIVFVYAVTRQRTYIASYAYSNTPGASDQGKAGAESLCPPPDPVVHLAPAPVDPPPGWDAEDPDAFGKAPSGIAYWVWDSNEKRRPERLVAITFPRPRGHAGLSYDFAAAAEHFTAGHAVVLQRSPTQLCHSTDAVYVEMRSVSNDGPTLVEAIFTLFRGRGYGAMYIRPASTAAQPDAERALHSLCPARTAT